MKNILSMVIVLLLFSTASFASGYSKPVWVGARAIGLGGAFVGLADDATAIYHNPAAMTYLSKGHHFYVGADALITDTDYTPTGAPTESAKREFLPVPSFAYVNNQMQGLSFGVGVFFPQGNGGKFSTPSANPIGNPLAGRFYTMEISPTIAWQVIPEISFGASLRIVRISNSVEGQTFIDPATFTVVDVVDKLDVSGWGVGGAFGMMVKPNDWLRMGVNYRTQIKKTLDGDGTFENLGDFEASLGQTIPTLVNIGFSAQATPHVLFSFAYGFERNKEIDELEIETDLIGNATLPQNWRNSHTYHFGVEIKPVKKFALLAGYARDFQNSIPDEVNNRISGDVAAHETSAGVGVFWTDQFSSTLTWNGRFGSRTIENNGLNIAPGEVEAFVHTLSLGLNFAI